MSQWDTRIRAAAPAPHGACVPTPGEAWAAPGLLSPVLCSAGAALLPGGGEGTPWESVGDAAWGSVEEEGEEEEEERSRGLL